MPGNTPVRLAFHVRVFSPRGFGMRFPAIVWGGGNVFPTHFRLSFGNNDKYILLSDTN